jgi:RimJ/RimL family protein N-acetyltransferase
MKAEASVQPVGPVVDAAPAPLPGPVTLKGRFGHIEKLDASRIALDLWAALRDHNDVWAYMSYGPFADAGTFSNFVNGLAASDDPYYYAIFDREGRAQGWASLMRVTPAMRAIEIGSIVYAPSLQRTPLATEVQYLLARYVFETLGYRRYEWKCDALNAPSRRAAERFGFSFEGIFRQHMIVKGHNRDTAWFAMLDSEWPRAKAAFEAWLSDENFDEKGRQRRSLAALRGGL